MATVKPRPKPYIPASTVMAEFTLRAVVLGTLLGIVFGASSLYLVLKVGLTVSASIPVAVISVTVFRLLSKIGFRDASILENNIVQTAGSAGESIAFGVGVTMPAILILGFDLEIGRVMLVSVLGGLLGILMMIPLRRALIDNQHDVLKYPEGTACAEVLKAGASVESRAAAGDVSAAGAGTSGVTIFGGFVVGLVYKLLMSLFFFWKDVPEKIFGKPLQGGSVAGEVSPELMGVGYIIGARVSFVMCAGGVLAYLVLIPLIKYFGAGLTEPLAPGHSLISEMGPDEIRSAYILYIGAGAVAAGGIISLVKSLPMIWRGLASGLKDLRGGGAGTAERTDRDLPMGFVLIGILALMAAILLAPSLHMNVLGAVMIVVFGFLFVTVSSRLTGEIGSSSNPISGMTVATLLLTCLVFLIIGWTGNAYYVTALSVGAVVCIAASNGGTTSQDLKTGWLVGGTPRLQQIAILIGAGVSALALGPILLKLNDTGTVYAPQMIVGKFTPEEGQPSAIAPQVAAALPSYSADVKPAGDFGLLASDGKDGLTPGRYLVARDGTVAFALVEAFGKGLTADAASLGGATETLTGPQAEVDTAAYRVWQKSDDVGGPPGKYLVDGAGVAKYLVDPGINGQHGLRPDGTGAQKFSAPKATLMSYIIKGILNHELPWALVLLGVMIAIMLEMSGIPSLAFAVGVYLPLSSSTPILVGGLVRWLVDRRHRARHVAAGLNEEEITAESDKSPGVLLASGYIAGGAIAGIFVAYAFGFMDEFINGRIEWSAKNNPFFAGPNADLLSTIPFLLIGVLLLWIGAKQKPAQPATT
jgi:putative OPT family oligopeptide transporter